MPLSGSLTRRAGADQRPHLAASSRIKARSTTAGADWIRVSPCRSGGLDPTKLDYTLATKPLPVNGKEFNILVVHYTHRHETGGYVRDNIAHHDDLDRPTAKEKLADDE